MNSQSNESKAIHLQAESHYLSSPKCASLRMKYSIYLLITVFQYIFSKIKDVFVSSIVHCVA